MAKTILVCLSALVLAFGTAAYAVTMDAVLTGTSVEANQTTSEKCLASTLYLQSVCFLADGDTDKCLALVFLYGVPCVLFDTIWGDDEITMAKCLVGSVYIQTACLASDGDALKCTALTSSTFYLPCMYRATTSYNDPVSGE